MVNQVEENFCSITDCCRSRPQVLSMLEAFASEMSVPGADETAVVRKFRAQVDNLFAAGLEMAEPAKRMFDTAIFLYYAAGVDFEEIVQAGKD